MDPRLLRTFSAVITHGSFSYAARELGDTQSAVSRQTASLEGELGVELVCRRPVGPTQAGARLMVHVASTLLRINAARAEVWRVKGENHRAADRRHLSTGGHRTRTADHR
ncbi:LysR family transcriptional regulator [Streptomyces microflavus]|uniref:LysR family transcriptional regulator n=1 Tax=Streptomyces microflavus TaxID=1919 RepID=UPI0036ED921F